MGASSAFQLAAAGMGRILVLEKGPGVGAGSTGRSTAIVRQTYSNLEVSRMAQEALALFHDWRDFTGVAEPKANFIPCGVLFLFAEGDPAVPQIQAMHAQLGIRSSLMDAAARREAFPDLDFDAPRPDEVAQGRDTPQPTHALLEETGGFADPVGTAEDMLDAARRHGVEVRFNTRVTAVAQQGGRVSGVTVAASGGTEDIAAPVVINCAGPWATALNAMAGQPLTHELVPTRIQVVTKAFNEQPKGRIPVMADMVTGFYGRLEASGAQMILGSVREEDEQEAISDPDEYNDVADAPFREHILTMLHHRVPTFTTRGRVGSYAGVYTVNRTDYHPIIDQSGLAGFYHVNGFSGHGFKLSPVVGMLVAQKVLGQWGQGQTAIPLDFFDHGRPHLRSNWGGVIA